MNTSARYSSSTACDPRCPYCGRPVIGAAVYGSEGAYHPECTMPPKPSVMEELLRQKPEPKPYYPMPAYGNWSQNPEP